MRGLLRSLKFRRSPKDNHGDGQFSSCLIPVSSSGFQRGHINGKAAFYITFQHTLIRFIDILDFNHFDIGSDSMLAVKIEDLQGFGDATNEGSVLM